MKLGVLGQGELIRKWLICLNWVGRPLKMGSGQNTIVLFFKYKIRCNVILKMSSHCSFGHIAKEISITSINNAYSLHFKDQ